MQQPYHQSLSSYHCLTFPCSCAWRCLNRKLRISPSISMHRRSSSRWAKWTRRCLQLVDSSILRDSTTNIAFTGYYSISSHNSFPKFCDQKCGCAIYKNVNIWEILQPICKSETFSSCHAHHVSLAQIHMAVRLCSRICGITKPCHIHLLAHFAC